MNKWILISALVIIVILGGTMLFFAQTYESNRQHCWKGYPPTNTCNDLIDIDLSKQNPITQKTITVQIEDLRPVTNALPITVTEKITHSKPLDLVKIWRIFPIIIEDGERERVIYLLNWGMESQYSLEYSFNVFDENQNEILDLDSKRGTMNYREGLGFVMATCPNNIKEEANFSSEWIVPLKPNFTSDVYVKYTEYALLPKDNEYRLKFSSFFDTQILLPDNAIVISNKTKSCSPDTGEWEKVNFFDIVFRLN